MAQYAWFPWVQWVGLLIEFFGYVVVWGIFVIGAFLDTDDSNGDVFFGVTIVVPVIVFAIAAGIELIWFFVSLWTSYARDPPKRAWMWAGHWFRTFAISIVLLIIAVIHFDRVQPATFPVTDVDREVYKGLFAITIVVLFAFVLGSEAALMFTYNAPMLSNDNNNYNSGASKRNSGAKQPSGSVRTRSGEDVARQASRRMISGAGY